MLCTVDEVVRVEALVKTSNNRKTKFASLQSNFGANKDESLSRR